MNSIFSRIKNIEIYQCVMFIALLAALIHFALVLFVVLSRINYRYDLEWMEGASLVQTYRLVAGQALYIQPSLEYIPMIYPPLYFELAAVLVKIIGIAFLPLRIISFVSTLGCLAIIYLSVKDGTKSTIISIVAAGSFAATFKLGGAWFDIARVDMLFIFLFLAGIFFLAKNSTKYSIMAGSLFALSFLTKQTALPIFIVVAASTLFLYRKQTLPFVGTFGILTLITYFYQNYSTNGWYQFYILILPASHQIKWASTPSALQAGFEALAIMIIIAVLPVFIDIRQVLKDKIHSYYLIAVVGIFATSVLARINRGAYINTLIPVYAGLSILFGLGIGWLVACYDDQRISKNIFQTILWLAIISQFGWLGYDPIQQIPTRADRRAGDALVAEIRTIPGDILIPYHNYLPLFAGKKANFHMVALAEIRGTYSTKQPEFRDILRQFNSTPLGLFIMDLPDNLIQKRHCADTRNISYESSSTFYPVTGYSVRPSIQSLDCP